ncbi:putative lipid-binding protein AIR1B [Hibiscus syriacus]|uniref:putative lipid-binding protein AIR1B n=1 Tax=Hibiscus syriacus TaxID=106335 RepID=UPI001923663A|nr:putative lipid-binding protein AIR1B [Hibiscus syriacus]
MGSKVSASTLFLVSLNLAFFSLVSSQTSPTCPQDLGVCQSALTSAFFGARPNPGSECCKRFHGLSDADAADCMCRILRANSDRIPVSHNTVKNMFMRYCGRNSNTNNCP